MSMYGKENVRPVLICGKSMTKQSFGKQCDINAIVSRYEKTGMLDHVRKNPGVFVDVSNVGDYQQMTAKIRFAQEAFEQLPSALKERFQNDPAKLVEFMSDDANREEAVKLGMLPKPKADAVVAVKPKVTAKEPPVAKAEETAPAD